jgi:hypothetical protein
MTAKGFDFTQPPRAEHGAMIARFRGMDGGKINVSGPMP